MTPEHLFVYGTLRRDATHEMSRFLAAHAEHLGAASFQGRLYRISWYPGAVPSDDPADQVRGDVYELRDVELVLARLDDFEACGPGHSEPTEYLRKRETVRLTDGRLLEAWVYVFNRAVDRLERIASGDFTDR